MENEAPRKRKGKGLEQARAYAFLLLKYRPRSKQELAERLRRRKFPGELIGQVVGSLEEKGFLDDAAFAKAWIASRAGRFGPRRIRQELRRKGIDTGLIDAGLREMRSCAPEEETIRQIAEEKAGKLKNLDPVTAKRRIYAYFLRRGFSPETVSDVLNRIL